MQSNYSPERSSPFQSYSHFTSPSDEQFTSTPSNPNADYMAVLNITPETGSIEEGEKFFGAIIKPIKVSTFMEKYWQKQPYQVSRGCPDYYKDLLSIEKIDEMLRENHVKFTKNIDVTQYKNGVCETLNLNGRALPHRVFQHYEDGYTIRILNSQIYFSTIHSMNATLQEYFHCITGASVYLTPSNSQGFAPHYDDIEAFVLQIEGKKRWRLYPPRNRNEKLPRESSKDFSPNEIGQPCLDVVLEAGDLLYFPRGYIHQANTEEDSHSLHLTLSVYQKQTYGDLLEILLPIALKEAINENITLRKGLPLNIWQHMGSVNSDKYLPERDAMIKEIKKCFEVVCRSINGNHKLYNSAVDQMAIRYQNNALPPTLTEEEKLCTVYGTKPIVYENGELDYPYIKMDTKIRLIRSNILRLVEHDTEIRVHYSSQNSKDHGLEVHSFKIDPDDVKAVAVLINAYPQFITPDLMQTRDLDRNLAIAQGLWHKGVLMSAEPLI